MKAKCENCIHCKLIGYTGNVVCKYLITFTSDCVIPQYCPVYLKKDKSQKLTIPKDYKNCTDPKIIRSNTIKEIIDKVEDMIGGKLIAQALREIYWGEEEE